MTAEPAFPASPEGQQGERQRLLKRSVELTRQMDSSRALWDEGKGKDYGTATSYMSAAAKRRGVIAQLRSQFQLVVDNTK